LARALVDDDVGVFPVEVGMGRSESVHSHNLVVNHFVGWQIHLASYGIFVIVNAHKVVGRALFQMVHHMDGDAIHVVSVIENLGRQFSIDIDDVIVAAAWRDTKGTQLRLEPFLGVAVA
jgi:hypothetical protein